MNIVIFTPGQHFPTVSIIGLGLPWKPCRRPQGMVAGSEWWNWPAEWDRRGGAGLGHSSVMSHFLHSYSWQQCYLPLCSKSPRHLEKQCSCHMKMHQHFFVYSQWPMILQVGQGQSPWPDDAELFIFWRWALRKPYVRALSQTFLPEMTTAPREDWSLLEQFHFLK